MARLANQEKMIQAYTGRSPSPSAVNNSGLRPKSYIEITDNQDVSFDTIARAKNDYSPMLPSISPTSSKVKVNFLKRNMSIANQVVRSYRSFSRRHAYNLKYEVTDGSENNDYDLQKDSSSTNAASSPKPKRHKVQPLMSRTSKSVVPERVIQVKPIEGREMLESIAETKETEKKLIDMKNRVGKLLKEREKALSNIRLAKNRVNYIGKINVSKDRDKSAKYRFRQMMNLKIQEQKQEIARRRRQMKENIANSKKQKIEENRFLKNREKQTKVEKAMEAQQKALEDMQRVRKLKSQVISHKKNKSNFLTQLNNSKNDMNQIRYHLKNEKLAATRGTHQEQIDQLKMEEQKLLQELEKTMQKQEAVESEANSPSRLRRAPSLNIDAKFAMFKGKVKDPNQMRAQLQLRDSQGSFYSKESAENEVSIKLCKDE
ncbi:unnamed protein product [Moneuplotes crassus]|uniref:Uncharacterized protein n=1 Tax=Euplotes crassus TaxID=5936 RepID=A0AAD1XF70_EUPCR|nr:unnamed protein product [Moneuplotes crassus]